MEILDDRSVPVCDFSTVYIHDSVPRTRTEDLQFHAQTLNLQTIESGFNDVYKIRLLKLLRSLF